MIRADAQAELKKTLVDGASGARVRFHYRRPTNAEQLAFNRRLDKGKPGGRTERLRKLGKEAIKPLISGITFPDEDTALSWEKDGQMVMLSCKAGDDGYREDWLAVIEAFAPGLLKLLGIKVFVGDDVDDEAAEEDDPNF